jgi:hypothetical protein
MEQISNDEDNTLKALPAYLIGVIFDSRILTGKTFSIDSDSKMLVAIDSPASNSAILMDGGSINL